MVSLSTSPRRFQPPVPPGATMLGGWRRRLSWLIGWVKPQAERDTFRAWSERWSATYEAVVISRAALPEMKRVVPTPPRPRPMATSQELVDLVAAAATPAAKRTGIRIFRRKAA